MNCWEVIKCKRSIRKHCSAYPDRGKDCWKITGTTCKGGLVEKASLIEKLRYCRTCDFFKFSNQPNNIRTWKL